MNTKLEDWDGVDGPWMRRLAQAMRDDAQASRQREAEARAVRRHRCQSPEPCTRDVVCDREVCPSAPGRAHLCTPCAAAMALPRVSDREIAPLRAQGWPAVDITSHLFPRGGR